MTLHSLFIVMCLGSGCIFRLRLVETSYKWVGDGTGCVEESYKPQLYYIPQNPEDASLKGSGWILPNYTPHIQMGVGWCWTYSRSQGSGFRV